MEKYLDNSLSAEERAIALTDAMTVEEQASQLRYDAPAVERLGIPEYNWWNEGLHGLARSGIATMFPQAIGLAAMFDTELTEKVAEITAEEARANLGITGGGTRTLLWTNASPTSTFNAQTIQLGASDYDAIIVESTFGEVFSGSENRKEDKIIKGYNTNIGFISAVKSNSSYIGVLERNIEFKSNGNVECGEAYSKYVNQETSDRVNGNVIPLRIYGVKEG